MNKSQWIALCWLLSAPVWAQTQDSTQVEKQRGALVLQGNGEATLVYRQQAPLSERSLVWWFKRFAPASGVL